MDKKLYTCGLFIDLQKAFNTGNHSISLQKLSHYAMRGIINDWFALYLVGRKQTTENGPEIYLVRKYNYQESHRDRF